MIARPGSSPLTWGKPTLSWTPGWVKRLIPAHAGKTTSSTRLPRRLRAHPRSRGENYQHATRERDAAGSSPLTRGKPGACRRAGGDHGLIPAHAGKTRLSRPTVCLSRAHPRSRGENGLLLADQRVVVGSSPLTRGKRSGRPQLPDGDGLIPAHAGKTQVHQRRRGTLGAHPRSRGENAG